MDEQSDDPLAQRGFVRSSPVKAGGIFKPKHF